MHIAERRSSFPVIGSTAFTLLSYWLLLERNIPWRTRDARRRRRCRRWRRRRGTTHGVLYLLRPLSPPVCRRLGLVGLGGHTAYLPSAALPSSSFVFILFLYYVNSNTLRCHGAERRIRRVCADRRVTSLSDVRYVPE